MSARTQSNVMVAYAAVMPLLGPHPCRSSPAAAMLSAFSLKTQPERRVAVETRDSFADTQRSAWMAAAQAGDAAAYQALLRDCIPVIKSVVRRRGVPADRLDDAVQDVLLTIHRARQTYDPQRSFTAWMSVIAERRAIDLLRRTQRQQVREVYAPLEFESHADESADPAQGVVQLDASGAVATALAGLPVRQREAVQHLVLEERSLEEAAALTRRSKGSLKVNLHRALKALRGRMAPGSS
jgi:RNA polymerase sigma factor (sigma-70 family)